MRLTFLLLILIFKFSQGQEKNSLVEGDGITLTSEGIIISTIDSINNNLFRTYLYEPEDGKGGSKFKTYNFISKDLSLFRIFHDTLTVWYSNGKIKSQILYEFGKPIKVLEFNDPSGEPRYRGTFKNGFGCLHYYSDLERLKEIACFNNGLREGPTVEYFSYPNDTSEIVYYKRGLRDGLYNSYHFGTGKSKVSGSYIENLRDGTFTYWDSEGNIYKVELWNKGELVFEEIPRVYDRKLDSLRVILIKEFLSSLHAGINKDSIINKYFSSRSKRNLLSNDPIEVMLKNITLARINEIEEYSKIKNYQILPYLEAKKIYSEIYDVDDIIYVNDPRRKFKVTDVYVLVFKDKSIDNAKFILFDGLNIRSVSPNFVPKWRRSSSHSENPSMLTIEYWNPY